MSDILILQAGISTSVFSAAVAAVSIIPVAVSFFINYYESEAKDSQLDDEDLEGLKNLIWGLIFGLWMIYLSMIIALVDIVGGISVVFNLDITLIGWSMIFIVGGITLISAILTMIVKRVFDWWS